MYDGIHVCMVAEHSAMKSFWNENVNPSCLCTLVELIWGKSAEHMGGECILRLVAWKEEI